MFNPIRANKGNLAVGIAAAAAVLGSGLAMGQMGQMSPSIAGAAPPFQAAGLAPEIISQAAIAPDARNDLPAIASCPISLELMDEGNATIGATLLSPCNPGQELVIAHGGIVVSAKTLASGALFISLPALEHPAQVDVRFSSGETATAELEIPDALAMQRVAVQWPEADGFDLHGFENGADFGDKGHIWAQASAKPAMGAIQAGGYLTVLGDASVSMPLMAQVFTYGSGIDTEVTVEASVTQNNCGRELMGDVLFANFGSVRSTEVSVAMPGCDAVGDYVQLGTIKPDQNLAMLH